MSYRPILKRPRILVGCAALYALAPLINLLMIAMKINRPFLGEDGFLMNAHPVMLISLVLNPVVGYGIYTVHSWGWFTFVAYSIFLVGGHLWMVLDGSFPWWSVAGVIALTAMTMMVLIRSGVRAPFFDPKVRKWEQALRIRAPVDVRLYCGDLITDAQTSDVSSSGCFVRMQMDYDSIGAPVMVTLNRRRFPIHAIGEIVRVSSDPERGGVGVRFMSIDPRSKENLVGLITELRSGGPADEKETPTQEKTRAPSRRAS